MSPRSAGCERCFIFSFQGEISVARNDEAAGETVKRLGLDNIRLKNLRKEAIAATLEWRGRNPLLLDLPSARKRLTSLEDAESAGGRLEPFCFAFKTSTPQDIRRMESIPDSKRGRRTM